MIQIYASKKTTVKLDPVKKIVIKTTSKPLNEKEYEIQELAYKLGIAPKIINHSFDNIHKKLIIEMEYVDGITLDNYLKQPTAEKKKAKHALFIALNKLYNKGIDHKDLNGNNIIIVTEDGKLGVKIIDYGHAKLYPHPIEARLRDFSSFNNRNW